MARPTCVGISMHTHCSSRELNQKQPVNFNQTLCTLCIQLITGHHCSCPWNLCSKIRPHKSAWTEIHSRIKEGQMRRRNSTAAAVGKRIGDMSMLSSVQWANSNQSFAAHACPDVTLWVLGTVKSSTVCRSNFSARSLSLSLPLSLSRPTEQKKLCGRTRRRFKVRHRNPSRRTRHQYFGIWCFSPDSACTCWSRTIGGCHWFGTLDVVAGGCATNQAAPPLQLWLFDFFGALTQLIITSSCDCCFVLCNDFDKICELKILERETTKKIWPKSRSTQQLSTLVTI